jgi:hypothetical protein
MTNYDPYEMVALVYAGYICDNCQADLLDNPTVGFNQPEWEKAMAQYAKDQGWLCLAKNDDWIVKCPRCKEKT